MFKNAHLSVEDLCKCTAPGPGAPDEGGDSRGNALAPFYPAPLSVAAVKATFEGEQMRVEAMGVERRCRERWSTAAIAIFRATCRRRALARPERRTDSHASAVAQ